MKKSYLNLCAVVIAFGITGCLEDLAAGNNNTAAQEENTQTAETPDYSQLVASNPYLTNQTAVTPTATDPVAVDPVAAAPAADPVVVETPADPAPVEPFYPEDPLMSESQLYETVDVAQLLITASGDTIVGGVADPLNAQLSVYWPKNTQTVEQCGNVMWCGAAHQPTVKTDLGDNSGSIWFFYTDDANDGTSEYTWPTEWENVYNVCDGICGMATLGDGYMYPYMGVGFFVVDSESSGDVTDWGGVCVSYTSDKPMRLALHPNDELQQAMGYDDYRYNLKSGTNVTINIPWKSFRQDGWGIAFDRDELLTQLQSIVFVYQDMGSGITSSFNILKVGKLGTCN